MKLILYFLVFNLLLVSALSASWGSVDFIIYKSDDPYVFPLVIDVENLLWEEFTAELYVKTIYSNGSFGESEMHKLIDIPINPELLYLDFPISALERNNDVLVIVEYNDESEEALHNSIDRFNSINGELLEEDIDEVSLDDNVQSKFKISTVVGVIIVLLLFAIVGFVAWLALKD